MIQRGMTIRVRDASGEWLVRRALSGVQPGHDFPVIWACRPEAWDQALLEERREHLTGAARDSVRLPWPAEDVETVE